MMETLSHTILEILCLETDKSNSTLTVVLKRIIFKFGRQTSRPNSEGNRLHFSENHMILASAILSQDTHATYVWRPLIKDESW